MEKSRMVATHSRSLLFVCCLAGGLALQALAADVSISEFMAANDASLTDEDGDSSDWIEIYNASTSAVALTGWYLTDRTNDLARWAFPATNLAAGHFMVVFASGKDRRVPGAELHTDFKLDAAGEYLALVRPDGVSVAHAFAPAYPRQVGDVAYGSAVINLLERDGAGCYVVPMDSSMGTNWTGRAFDDSGWISAALPVGFDRGEGARLVAYWPLDGDADDATTNGLDGVVQGAQFTTVVSPAVGTGQALAFNGTSDRVELGTTTVLDLGHDFTVAAWIRRDNTSQDMILSCGYDGWGFRAQGDRLQFTTYGIRDYVSDAAGVTAGAWHHVAAVFDVNDDVTFYRNGVQVGNVVAGTVSATPSGNRAWRIGSSEYGANYLFGGSIDDVAVWDQPLSTNALLRLAQGESPRGVAGSIDGAATDVGDAMHGRASGLYLRQGFVIAGLPVGALTLRASYDDGFIAYLNGREVARRHAPATVTWDAAATTNRSGDDALSVETIPLGDAAVLLQPGTNLLAVHCLNAAVDDDDFLFAAELALLTAEVRYFASPSPGSWNVSGTDEIGPLVRVEQHVPGVPGEADPVIVTAAVSPLTTNLGLQSVSLGYRVMYGSETTVAMRDDGMAPDLVSGDGLYAASIPAAAAGPGEMVRWYVSAADAVGNVSRYPRTNGTDRTARYLGTVVADPSVPTNLPVLYWYVPDPAWHREASGNNLDLSEASCWFAGQFYDNFLVRVRGSAARNWPKPKLKFDFNPGDHFRFDPAERRVEEFNLQSFYKEMLGSANTSYMREPLAFDLLREAGVPACLSFPIYVVQNGAFYGLHALVEQVDETFLERNGYDPDASMYKAINVPGTCDVNPAVPLYRKVGRKEEPWDDVTAFCYHINESRGSSRFAYAMDHVDVAQVINEMAAQAMMVNHDRLTKNYYLYLEPDTGEWHRFPWDLDQSFAVGQKLTAENWASLLYGDDSHTQELSGGAPNPTWQNHFYDVILDNPVTRGMYLRRVRTLMDTVRAPAIGFLTNRIAHYEQAIRSAAEADDAKWGAGDIDDGLQELLAVNLPTRWAALSADPMVPPSQVGVPSIRFGAVDASPASGNQDQEYVELVNTNGMAVDVSGWMITGGVEVVFQPGCVISANSNLIVAADNAAFRARDAGPSGGQHLFVQGPYRGHLSSWGESLWLRTGDGVLVDHVATATDPSPVQRYLRVTEIMYHPRSGPTNGTYAADDYEFIEFRNIGRGALDLSGVYFTNGVSLVFSNVVVAGGDYVVVVANREAFAERYATNGLTIAGPYDGRLANNGEALKLDDALGNTVVDVDYDDDWFPMTDGFGLSLACVTSHHDCGGRTNWRASVAYDGTPGRAADAVDGTVWINEVLSHTDVEGDWIELHGPAGPVDVGGWLLSDDASVPASYRIPLGTVIPAGGYVVFGESALTDTNSADVLRPFALSELGDDVHLWAASNDVPVRYAAGVSFGAAEREVTFGRHVTSDGRALMVAMAEATRGQGNSAPMTGPVVVSELMYAPASNGIEFIEIYNATAFPQPLYDPAYPSNTWTLTGVGTYRFPDGVTLAPRSFAVVCAASATVFRAAAGLGPAVPVHGPWAGALDNGGEAVQLWKPGSPEPDGSVPRILVDGLAYDDVLPWPTAAASGGIALERVRAHVFGDDPLHWVASAPGGTPGRSPLEDRDGDSLPDNWERTIFGGLDAVGIGTPDLDADGLSNPDEYRAGTGPTNAASAVRVGIEIVAGRPVLQFDALDTDAVGYFGLSRLYELDAVTSLTGGIWQPVRALGTVTGKNQRVTHVDEAGGTTCYYRVRARLEDAP